MSPPEDAGASNRHPPEATSPPARRLRLTLAYDGQPWQGWQSLSNGQGIQDRIERAFLIATGQTVRVHGSGRTDAGVHALGQTAHADVTAGLKMPPASWVDALNAALPPSIRVIACEDAAPDFHARFHAAAKVYRYKIWRPRILDPFQAGRAWHVYGPLDTDALRRCASIVLGTHNFARLSACRGDISDDERREDEAGLTRTLTRVDVHDAPPFIEIEIEGDGFLYKMARMIVGSMVRVARGRETEAWFRDLVENPAGLKTNQTAPADGLYLVRVLYPARSPV
jgi:tRNA pseudouridine38-40 synthase